MSTSVGETSVELQATQVTVTPHHLTVAFSDGRVVSLPLTWFPRLAYASPGHRQNAEIGAFGIHWPDLNEDLSYDGIVAGKRSGESRKSFLRWLRYYSKGKLPPIKSLPLPPRLAEEMMREGIDIGEEERQQLVARRRRRKAS